MLILILVLILTEDEKHEQEELDQLEKLEGAAMVPTSQTISISSQDSLLFSITINNKKT